MELIESQWVQRGIGSLNILLFKTTKFVNSVTIKQYRRYLLIVRYNFSILTPVLRTGTLGPGWRMVDKL